ncbi:MAG: TIGR03943 family protein [Chloroflexota bacterium]
MTAIPMHEHEHEHPHNHRREAVQQAVKAALLVGLGMYFLYNIASGNITNYVSERFSWLSYVAAGLFLLIGAFSVWHLLNDRRESHEHHDHTHAPISWGVLAILAVPLALGTLIPSRPLGAEAVSGDMSMASAATVGVSESFNVPPEQRNVLDWLRAFNRGNYAQFDGQPADVIGFMYTEPGFDANKFMVARFAISCCVADASALGVPVYWQQAADLPQGQWVRVKGTFKVDVFRGDDVPVLQAATIDRVDQPEHPYLYP